MLNLDLLSENGGHVDKCSACTAEIFKTFNAWIQFIESDHNIISFSYYDTLSHNTLHMKQCDT